MTTREWKGIPSPHIYIVSRYGERSRWRNHFLEKLFRDSRNKSEDVCGRGIIAGFFITGIPIRRWG